MTHLFTFTTYGTHLRGDPRGSIDRHENEPGQPTLDPSPHLHTADQARLQSPPITLDEPQRRLVLESIQQTCDYRGWLLHAAHIRTNHVHAIISSDAPAGHILRDLKAYASRHLNRAHGHHPKRWTRGGSTRSLPTPEAIQAATRYVIEAQGSPMAFYLAPPGR